MNEIQQAKPADKPRKLASDGKNYPWLDYEPGYNDINGHKITSIHARCPDFVILDSECSERFRPEYDDRRIRKDREWIAPRNKP